MVVSLRMKVTAITSCTIMMVFIVVSMIFYYGIKQYTIGTIYTQALGLVQATQMMIDGNTFHKVMKTEDIQGESYRELKETLSTLNHIAQDDDLFIIGTRDNDYIYLTDSMKEYTLSEVQFLENPILTKEVMDEIVQTLNNNEPYYFNEVQKGYRKGSIGVIAPIINNNDKIVGIIGYQRNDAFFSDMRYITWIIILSCIIIIIVCTALNYWALRKLMIPVEEIVAAMKKIAAGDFKIQLDTKRKDELGIIAKELIESCESINCNVDYMNTSVDNLSGMAREILNSAKKGMVEFEKFATSTKEVSLISYEQVDKREKVKRILTYLEEDIRIIMENIHNEENGSKVHEELIAQISIHIANLNKQLCALDSMFDIIDNHVVNLAVITDQKMVSSQKFNDLAKRLKREIESLNNRL